MGNSQQSVVDHRGRPNPIVWLLAALFLMFFSANGIMIWLAVEASPNLVRPDYYDYSLRHDQRMAQERESARLGWSVSPELLPGGFRLTLRDASGAVLPGMKARVWAYRADRPELDQALSLVEAPLQSGTYEAVFKSPASGLWKITLEAIHESDRFFTQFPLIVPGR